MHHDANESPYTALVNAISIHPPAITDDPERNLAIYRTCCIELRDIVFVDGQLIPEWHEPLKRTVAREYLRLHILGARGHFITHEKVVYIRRGEGLVGEDDHQVTQVVPWLSKSQVDTLDILIESAVSGLLPLI